MNICGSHVETPWDDKSNFSPKWRHQVARAMVGKKVRGMLPEEIKHDNDITNHYNYLTSLQNPKQDDCNYYNSSFKYEDNNIATKWFDCEAGILKHYLESLLLTQRSYEDIAIDLNADVSVIKTYERLFFNIRDNYGRTCYSPALKIKFAIGNVIKMTDLGVFETWKLIGAQLGYGPLTRSWGWRLHPDNDVDEITYQRSRGHIVERVVKGTIGNYDLNDMQSKYIDNKRLLLDTKQQTEGETGLKEVDAFGITLIQALAPTMLQVHETLEEKAAMNAAIQQKLLVQGDIDKVQLADKGPQNASEEFNKELQRKAESLR